MSDLDYRALNAKVNLLSPEGTLQLEADQKAIKQFFKQEIKPNMIRFDSLEDKIAFLIENKYYEKEIIDQYRKEFVKELFKKAYKHKFRFSSFMGAYKFYTSYAMKTFDGKKYLETFEDRVVANALLLGNGNEKQAVSIMEEIISGRYQPATPTFLNASKKQRGGYVSCFILRVSDNMESISRAINDSLQLSKRGGGVALNLTDIREAGAPIKKVEGQSSGIIPVMKLLEDSFSYANQLGQRQGAGAVYLQAHHPDIMRFLDTKRENADEKIRIKTLSLGIVVPDITFQLAKENKDMFLFSPYDVERVYGMPFSEISVTEKYEEMVSDNRIKKYKINARKFFQTIAELQFESGYPYLLFEDTATRENPNRGRINVSNLCSEILEENTVSLFNEDGSFDEVGKDISCNLGSLNIVKAFDSPDFSKTVEASIRALTTVSDVSNITCSPSIYKGNAESHAIGLGQMNLHGFFAKNFIHYDSPEALEFTEKYFYAVLYQVLKASNKIAIERGESYSDFAKSKYADGTFFDKLINKDWAIFENDKIKKLFEQSTVFLPKKQDWEELRDSVMEHGIYHKYLQAVAPTGSISYINHSTSSIHPIVKPIEIRKEGKLGRVYCPAPYLSDETMKYYKNAYDIGNEAIINIYAKATQFVDQGLSLTLFYPDTATTRDLNKAYVHAFKSGIKTIYYARIRQTALDGTEVDNAGDYCVSCTL